MEKSKLKKSYALALAALAFGSIIWQFCITTFSSVDFFSYFTTICNLLIAFSLSISTLFSKTKAGQFCSKLSVQSAIAVYISIVSLVYNFALRGIWTLTGIAWMLDNLVHVVIPVLYFLFWIFFRAAGKLSWKDGLYWLIFPLCYLVYSLLRGAIINWYPYPFLNATKLGYNLVFFYIIIMLGIFLIAGLILIRVTNRKGKVKI